MRGDIVFVERHPLGVKAPTADRANPDSCFLDRLVFRFFTYKHYGVDIGEEKIIHFYCSSVLKIHQASILTCSVEEFSKDGLLQIDEVSLEFSPEEIARRAEAQLGSDFDGYQIKHNNCEHFAMWCATGRRSGKQDLVRDVWQYCLGYPSLAKKKALSAISAFSFLQ